MFVEAMEIVKVTSLGQITDALFEVGGKYRQSVGRLSGKNLVNVDASYVL